MKNHYPDVLLKNTAVDFDYRDLIKSINNAKYNTLGLCLQNALSLGDELYKNNIECDILWGGYYTKDLETNNIPQTIKEAEESPVECIHFWFEVPTYDIGPLIIETASEHPEYKGQKVIFENRPKNYIVFPNSRHLYKNSMTEKDFHYDF